ncbi:hypothetical protein ACH5RR_013161 [Cinchona calisaya]|uniref:Uncharacterized protein n=1 Tax=Cinchona calisaya TaxID=153742 RepID=A0ABD2ZZ87_9GENT
MEYMVKLEGLLFADKLDNTRDKNRHATAGSEGWQLRLEFKIGTLGDDLSFIDFLKESRPCLRLDLFKAIGEWEEQAVVEATPTEESER